MSYIKTLNSLNRKILHFFNSQTQSFLVKLFISLRRNLLATGPLIYFNMCILCFYYIMQITKLHGIAGNKHNLELNLRYKIELDKGNTIRTTIRQMKQNIVSRLLYGHWMIENFQAKACIKHEHS